jgi:hypothetical protein
MQLAWTVVVFLFLVERVGLVAIGGLIAVANPDRISTLRTHNSFTNAYPIVKVRGRQLLTCQ